MKDESLKKWKVIVSSLILPVLLIIGNFLFSLALPLAGWTISWINPKDVIKATNGPSMLVYKYFTKYGTAFPEPFYFDMTPQQDVDCLRCHVGYVYLVVIHLLC